MKKFICILLSAVILIGTFIIPASASSETRENTITKNRSVNDENYELCMDKIKQLISWDSYEEVKEQSATYSTEKNAVKITPNEQHAGGTAAEPKWGNTEDRRWDESYHPYGTHGFIIKYANDLLKEDYQKKVVNDPNTPKNYITSTYLDLTYEMAKKCDDDYGPKKNDQTNPNWCRAFHGDGNYYATLQFLWEFARFIGTNKAIIDNEHLSIEDYIKKARKYAYNKLPNSEKAKIIQSDKKAYLTILADCAEGLVKNNYKPESGAVKYVSGQTWAGRCKYIILGMTFHLFGDIYAHKVLLKKDSIKYLKKGNENDFKESHEEHYLNPKHFKTDCNKDGLISAVREGILPIFKLKDYTENQSLQRTWHKEYADNPMFYTLRVYDAADSVKAFLENYKTTVIEKTDLFDCIDSIYGYSLYNSPTKKGKFI